MAPSVFREAALTLVDGQREDEIPIVGSSGFLSSYLDAFTYLLKAPEFIQRGYELYPNGIFRVAQLYYWEYIVCGPKFVNEVGNTRESVLSFYAGVDEVRACPFFFQDTLNPLSSSADDPKYYFFP
jgi:hypothetical protein